MKFFWNHDKSFQQTAAFASLWCWDMQMLIWCFGVGILRRKTFVFRNNAEQSKLTALNNDEWMNNTKNALETHALTRAFFLHRTRKTCEDLACALTIYLWAVLYIPTITLMSVNNYLTLHKMYDPFSRNTYFHSAIKEYTK